MVGQLTRSETNRILAENRDEWLQIAGLFGPEMAFCMYLEVILNTLGS